MMAAVALAAACAPRQSRSWRRARAAASRVARTAAQKEANASATLRPTFDYAYWEENAEEAQKNADNRRFKCDVAAVVEKYKEYRTVAYDLKLTRERRNANAKSMKGKMEPDERQRLIAEGKEIKEKINKLDASEKELDAELIQLASAIPNMSHPDTPVGEEENAVTVRINGEPRTSENAGFTLKDHLEIGKVLDMFDFDSGGKVSGQKFLYMRKGAALLEMALAQWALHSAVKAGFTPLMTPDLVRNGVVAGCGFAPRENEATQIYEVADTELCLAGTAEIPVAGIFMNETLIASKELPQKLVAFGHAFRTEAGSSGSENRGIYRLHQFSKVELFAVTRGDIEVSNELLQEIRQLEEDMFASLGLCYRVLDMPTEELGAPAYRKYDIEAWMPGMQKWGEISSCSSCTDYQARRLNIRHKEEYTQKGDLKFAHTLNGTACAVPRMIIAILETHQNEDGTVTVPEVLRPYMMGIEVLRPEE